MGLNAIEYDAAKIVQAHRDDGDAFWRRMRESISFANAIEDARHLRAYAPGKLSFAVMYPHLTASLRLQPECPACEGPCLSH